ncbi:protein rlx, partial [Staphylococcus saprophyticus]
INSVDLETGKKYPSNKKQRELVKQENDNDCREHGVSVTERGTAKMRYTLAEKGIVFDTDEYSWTDEWRDQIENAKA